MRLADRIESHLPPRYRELAKFLVVGGISYIVDAVTYFAVVHTVLPQNPITAAGISAVLATILSYVLTSEWTFATRGGRRRRHEAALFFIMNGVAMAISLVPLAASRYVLGLRPPNASATSVTIGDFVSSFVVGVGLGMIFRFWSYRRFVFPQDLSKPDT